MSHILSMNAVKKSFGQLEILTGVQLDIKSGERHAVIGPNGAGKSTLFNLISGSLAPTSGVVSLKGETISGMSPEEINRKGLSRSFQITNIFHRLSVFENLRVGVISRHGLRLGLLNLVSRLTEINAETEALLEAIHLQDRRNHVAGDLTYSEQRALEIGMTLSTGAEVILLDEPTAGMSRDETARAIDLIRAVTEGKTLLMVEHDMGVVFELCDRISVLVYGTILATGTPDEIRNNPDVQNAYLGEEAH